MEPCRQEQRIRSLELSNLSHSKDIQSLIKSLKELTNWIKIMVGIFVPAFISLLGFLITNWVKG